MCEVGEFQLLLLLNPKGVGMCEVGEFPMDSDKSSHCPSPRPPHTPRNKLEHFSFLGRKYQNLRNKTFWEKDEEERTGKHEKK